jgi:hypothetical protein
VGVRKSLAVLPCAVLLACPPLTPAEAKPSPTSTATASPSSPKQKPAPTSSPTSNGNGNGNNPPPPTTARTAAPTTPPPSPRPTPLVTPTPTPSTKTRQPARTTPTTRGTPATTASIVSSQTQSASPPTSQNTKGGTTPAKQPDAAAKHVRRAKATPLLDRPVPEIARTLALETARTPEFPLAILGVVAIFLLLQHRIDRRDPKLAHPTSRDDPALIFGPPATRPTEEP